MDIPDSFQQKKWEFISNMAAINNDKNLTLISVSQSSNCFLADEAFLEETLDRCQIPIETTDNES